MPIPRCCPPANIVRADYTQEAELLRAAADPHRLLILATLARNDDAVCACDFNAALGLNQATVSHHLKILRDAKLVRAERRGTWVHYTLAPYARRRLVDVLEVLQSKRNAA